MYSFLAYSTYSNVNVFSFLCFLFNLFLVLSISFTVKSLDSEIIYIINLIANKMGLFLQSLLRYFIQFPVEVSIITIDFLYHTAQKLFVTPVYLIHDSEMIFFNFYKN